jgi:hypothetical protein
VDVIYEGSFNLSVETHVNFLKMMTRKGDEETSDSEAHHSQDASSHHHSKKKDAANNHNKSSSSSKDNKHAGMPPHIFDSDADDSGESSEDEHDNDINKLFTSPYNPNNDIDPNSNNKPTKFMKFSEKIANSSFMNKSIVKKIVNNVAATPLVLSLKLK